MCLHTAVFLCTMASLSVPHTCVARHSLHLSVLLLTFSPVPLRSPSLSGATEGKHPVVPPPLAQEKLCFEMGQGMSRVAFPIIHPSVCSRFNKELGLELLTTGILSKILA